MASCSWRTYPGWLQRSKTGYVRCVSITAGDFIVKKDAQAVIPNDGKQTPTKGARGSVNLGFALTGAGAETLVPLGIAIFGGNKFFCNHLCGRVQFFSKLGGDLKCSRNKPTQRWVSSKWFPIWFFDIFPYNVWEYGISDVFSLCRNILLAWSHQTIPDLPCSIGMDIHCRNSSWFIKGICQKRYWHMSFIGLLYKKSEKGAVYTETSKMQKSLSFSPNFRISSGRW